MVQRQRVHLQKKQAEDADNVSPRLENPGLGSSRTLGTVV